MSGQNRSSVRTREESAMWRVWLRTLCCRSEGRYEQLFEALDTKGKAGAHASEQFFDNTLPRQGGWLPQMGYGHGVFEAGSEKNAANLGFYVEPCAFTGVDADEPAGTEGYVEISTRLAVDKLHSPHMDTHDIVCRAVDEAFSGTDVRIALEDYPSVEAFQKRYHPFVVARVANGTQKVSRGVWISMVAPHTIDCAGAPPPPAKLHEIAGFFNDRWERFAAIVQYARGFLASPPKHFAVDRKALLGFVGEYALWSDLQARGKAEVLWMGRWSSFDLRSDNRDYEVKSGVASFPEAPFFTVGEIKYALDAKRLNRAYDVCLASVGATEFDGLVKAIDISPNDPPPVRGKPASTREAWGRRLSVDVGVPCERLDRNHQAISEALQQVRANTELQFVPNPFAREPLSHFHGVQSRVTEGAIRISIR